MHHVTFLFSRSGLNLGGEGWGKTLGEIAVSFRIQSVSNNKDSKQAIGKQNSSLSFT